MFERFERPVKIICLALAVLLAWQVGSLLLSVDPLANLKIPALPTLAETTNAPAKKEAKNTNAAINTNVATGTNLLNGTNIVAATNLAAISTNTAAKSKRPGARKAGPPGMPPEMMGQMMPGGLRGGGLKKEELPPELQARVDRIVDSEIFGPIPRPMPMLLLGIADQVAFIQATNGQTDGVKVGGELAGIKLLRIGINRVLVELGGEKQELTIFDGIGGETLMPKTTNEPSTNAVSTNVPAAPNVSTNQALSSKP